MTVHVNWREDIACHDADPDLFFPIGTTGAALRQMEEAKRICRACPVQIQCLAWALGNGVADGVWGGTTPDERRVIRSLSRRTTNSKADDDDQSYHPAERGEHGIRAQAAPGKAARILRRAGIGPDAGGTGANLT
jgi:WhiB family redox-sensing transcriptional regulator